MWQIIRKINQNAKGRLFEPPVTLKIAIEGVKL
jgi:hypothetical protein